MKQGHDLGGSFAQTEVACVQNLFNLADQGSLDVLTVCAARAYHVSQ
jgi:hypothetical protein